MTIENGLNHEDGWQDLMKCFDVCVGECAHASVGVCVCVCACSWLFTVCGGVTREGMRREVRGEGVVSGDSS